MLRRIGLIAVLALTGTIAATTSPAPAHAQPADSKDRAHVEQDMAGEILEHLNTERTALALPAATVGTDLTRWAVADSVNAPDRCSSSDCNPAGPAPDGAHAITVRTAPTSPTGQIVLDLLNRADRTHLLSPNRTIIGVSVTCTDAAAYLTVAVSADPGDTPEPFLVPDPTAGTRCTDSTADTAQPDPADEPVVTPPLPALLPGDTGPPDGHQVYEGPLNVPALDADRLLATPEP
jgi:hypothetical protein